MKMKRRRPNLKRKKIKKIKKKEGRQMMNYRKKMMVQKKLSKIFLKKIRK